MGPVSHGTRKLMYGTHNPGSKNNLNHSRNQGMLSHASRQARPEPMRDLIVHHRCLGRQLTVHHVIHHCII